MACLGLSGATAAALEVLLSIGGERRGEELSFVKLRLSELKLLPPLPTRL